MSLLAAGPAAVDVSSTGRCDRPEPNPVQGAATTARSLLQASDTCAGEESIFVALLVGALTLAGLWAAWRAVLAASGRLARAYEKKLFSEAQFQVAAWMAVTTMVVAFAHTDHLAGRDRFIAPAGAAFAKKSDPRRMAQVLQYRERIGFIESDVQIS